MFEHTVLYPNRPGAAPRGHPLTTLEHVVLTPHVGAGTLDAFRATMCFCFANLTQPLRHAAGCLVDLDGIGPGR